MTFPWHGTYCKQCQEIYHIIIEALDDIISTSKNQEVISYQDTLLETAVIKQLSYQTYYYCNLTKRTSLQYHVP